MVLLVGGDIRHRDGERTALGRDSGVGSQEGVVGVERWREGRVGESGKTGIALGIEYEIGQGY